MMHLEHEIRVRLDTHAVQTIHVDLVIRVIRGALTGAAERRSEHDDASLGRPRELVGHLLAVFLLDLLIEEMVEPGHACGEQRLLLDAEHLGIDATQVLVADQRVRVSAVRGIVRIRRALETKTGIADRLETDAGMPDLRQRHIFTGVDKVEYRGVIVDEDVPASGDLEQVAQPGDDVLPAREYVAVPGTNIEALVHAALDHAALQRLHILRRALAVLLEEEDSIALARHQLGHHRVRRRENVLLHLATTALTVARGLVALEELHVQREIDETGTIRLGHEHTSIGVAVLAVAEHAVEIVKPLQHLIVVGDSAGDIGVPSHQFQTLFVGVLCDRLIIVTQLRGQQVTYIVVDALRHERVFGVQRLQTEERRLLDFLADDPLAAGKHLAPVPEHQVQAGAADTALKPDDLERNELATSHAIQPRHTTIPRGIVDLQVT